MSVESDMAKAKDLRKQSQTVKSDAAKRDFMDAADRLEKRAARGARKIGRKRRKATGGAQRVH